MDIVISIVASILGALTGVGLGNLIYKLKQGGSPR